MTPLLIGPLVIGPLMIGPLLSASVASASPPVVDGSRSAAEASGVYSQALSVQNTPTGYGDATNGDDRRARFGSEIDQVFAAVEGDRLYVLIAGNLEDNYNKLSVFIDSEPGGMSVLDGAAAPRAIDPFCCPNAGGTNGAIQGLDGLRFDAGFDADHFFAFSNGNEESRRLDNGATLARFYTVSSYYGDLTAGQTGRKTEIGYQLSAFGFEPGFDTGVPIDRNNNACSGPTDYACSPIEHLFAEQRAFENDLGFLMAINNSNTGGVTGSIAAGAASVQTGIEFSVPLSVLGFPDGDIRLAAFIGSSQYTNVSNQFAGEGVQRGNLGDPDTVNLAAIPGQQFVTIANNVATGDFNYDGAVNAADYTVWRDADAEGFEAVAGYGGWSAGYGVGGPVTAVPEPSVAVLVGLTLAATPRRWSSGR